MLNRTACDVLEEMRKCNETRNFCYLPGLIEELQSMCSRMESSLWDQKSFIGLQDKVKKLEKKIRKLRDKRDELEGKEGETRSLVDTLEDLGE